MPNISFFTHNMKHHIIRRQISYLELNNIYRIELICPSTEFHSDTIYIGEAAAVADLLKAQRPQINVTIFSADDIYRLDPFFKLKNLNLISTSWSLAELYNHINKIWNYYYQWNLSMANALCQGHDLEQIIHTAGHMLNGHVLLLNPGYVLLSQSLTDAYSDPYADEVQEKGYLDFDSVRFFKQHFKPGPGCHCQIGHFSLKETNNIYYTMPIHVGNSLLARLLFILNDMHRDMDIFEMIYSLGSIIGKLLVENYSAPKTVNSEFMSLLSDYAKRSTLNQLEVKNRFLLLPHRVEPILHCIIIHFNGNTTDVPYEFFLNQLGTLIPDCNTTIWNEEIVIMYSSKKRVEDFNQICDPKAFSQLLERFHAAAILSAATKHPEKFYTLYTLSDRLLQILISMEPPTLYKNIYRYEDHLHYLTIDLGCQQFQSILHHSEIIYLADSSIITLARYDQKHNSDLLSLLYHYLINGRNVTKTAQMMYMHRNTVLNKINKINDIIRLPLEDGQIQQRLLFSCQLIFYYQNFLSIKLSLD